MSLPYDHDHFALMVSPAESTPRDGSRFQRLTARVMSVAADGSPRNLTTDDDYGQSPYAGIVATAQADTGQHSMNGPDPVDYTYAWRFGLMADASDVIIASQADAS